MLKTRIIKVKSIKNEEILMIKSIIVTIETVIMIMIKMIIEICSRIII